MDSAQAQLADKLKSSNNILVTVSRNPSVDQLAACIALTLLLNKFNKHAAAVFSGQVPSTIEFLQPGETIEKNTDSLRDFIIALDKSKADKLRYKVEDDVVRIFITPYKTSISEADLDFSQGDFNVDVVVALGVQQQDDLDEAITAHGRILHDAIVTSINTSSDGNLGSLNWNDPHASSLSELVTELAQLLDPNLVDNQIATALLTGIVAETERFSNAKTSSQTMSASAALMAAGADQQLVATKLENLEPEQSDAAGDSTENSEEPSKKDDGMLEIEHDAQDEHHDNSDNDYQEHADKAAPEPEQPEKSDEEPQVKNDEQDIVLPEPRAEETAAEAPVENEQSTPIETTTPSDTETSANVESRALSPKLVVDPPSLGGTLTANSQPEALDPTTDPFSMPQSEAPQLLERPAPPVAEPAQPASQPEPIITGLTPPPPAWTPPEPNPLSIGTATDNNAQPTAGTLSELEVAVQSPHASSEDIDGVRDEVSRALNNPAADVPQPPIEALNSQPLGDALHATTPPDLNQTQPPTDVTASPQVTDPNAPPPVPPPIPFQFSAPPQASK